MKIGITFNLRQEKANVKSQATWIAKYPEFQCQTLRREETEKGEARQKHALAHISYRGKDLKDYTCTSIPQAITFGEGNTFLSLCLGTRPRLQYFQLDRNSAIFHTIANYWSLDPQASAGSTSRCKLRSRVRGPLSWRLLMKKVKACRRSTDGSIHAPPGMNKEKKKKWADTDIYFTGGLHGRDVDFESDVYMYQREFESIVVGMWERRWLGSSNCDWLGPK